MKTEPIDSNSWARLAEQIELASAERQTSNPVPSEPGPAVVPAAFPAAAEPVDYGAVPATPAPVAAEPANYSAPIEKIDLAEILPSEDLFGRDDVATLAKDGVRSHLAWGVGGFLLGALCWYFIGFWAFIGSLVFSGPEQVTSVERNIEAPARPRVLSYVKKRPSAPSVQSSRYCTAFHRNPGTNIAVPAKCQTIVRALGKAKSSDQ